MKKTKKVFSVIFGILSFLLLFLYLRVDKTGEIGLLSQGIKAFIALFFSLTLLLNAMAEGKRGGIIAAAALLAAGCLYGGYKIRGIVLDYGAEVETVILVDCSVYGHTVPILGGIYDIKGYDENGVYRSFDIDEGDYNRLSHAYRAMGSQVIVKYYPNTKCVQDIY